MAVHLLPLAQSVVAASGWDNTTRAIMLAGKALPILPDSLRTAENLIEGCDSDVWMAPLPLKPDTLAAWSPSKIVRGVLAVVLEKANQLTPSERAGYDFAAYLAACDLSRHLSQSRGNGLRGVVQRIQRQR